MSRLPKSKYNENRLSQKKQMRIFREQRVVQRIELLKLIVDEFFPGALRIDYLFQ